jgi:hypothetical protein
LRAGGADRDDYVRNGSLGAVTEVRDDGLVVDFERWGRVEVPVGYIEPKLSSGIVGGLQHAYAITTHAAQGATFATATPLITDASSAEGVYVGITRGQFDLQAVVIRERDVLPARTDDDLPALREETSALAATERHLEQSSPERLASEYQTQTRTSSDNVPYALWDDSDLCERWRIVDRHLKSARADIVRLEGDLSRRRALASSLPAEQSRFDAECVRRLGLLAARAVRLAPTLSVLNAELEARGVSPERSRRTADERSTLSDVELLASQVAVIAPLPQSPELAQ